MTIRIDENIIDGNDNEIVNERDRTLVFTIVSPDPIETTREVCLTLDLIIQGLAAHGEVLLHDHSCVGLHVCQDCQGLYYGNNVCDDCGHAHDEDEQVDDEEEQVDDEDEQVDDGGTEDEAGNHEITEIQQYCLAHLRVSDLEALDSPLELLAHGQLDTLAVTESEDSCLAELLVQCRLPNLPQYVWDRFLHDDTSVLYWLVRDCAPPAGHMAATGDDQHVFWDLEYLEECDDKDLAQLYLRLCRPGTDIPQPVLDLVSG